MKILHLSTSDIQGGAARAAYRLHSALRLAGHDSRMLVRYKHSTDGSVITATPDAPGEGASRSAFLCSVVQKYYIDANRTSLSDTIFSLPYPGYDLSSSSLVRMADVIDLHWVARFQSSVTLRSLVASGKPVVWTLHDQWPFTGGCHYSAGCEHYVSDCDDCPQLSEDPFNLPQAVLRDKLALFEDADLSVVAPSAWLASSARKSSLFKDRRVEVISNALDTDIFTPQPKRRARERLGLDAGETVILFVAQRGSDRRKGLGHLVAALQRCVEDANFQAAVERSQIRLLCFGHLDLTPGSLPIPLLSLGYLDSEEEISTAYSAADLFVLPSSEDNLPNTILEAMSCATPVVAFDAGGIPEAVKDGVTGRLVPSGDTGALAEAIMSLVSNAEERRALGQRARQVAVEEYALPVQASRYIALYEDLLADHPRSKDLTGRDRSRQTPDRADGDAGLPSQGSTVYLDTTLGPHSRAIHDQVLLRALSVAVRVMHSDHEAALEKLNVEVRDLRLQLAEIRGSRAWRLVHPLRMVAQALRRLRRKRDV